MSKPTALTLFAGGGLCDIGLKAAGFEVIGAVEYEPSIAEWYVHNHGDHVHVACVSQVDYRPYAGVDLLWASPCCTNASVANQEAGEAGEDLKSADAVCRAIQETNPRWFTLENVAPYAKFESFRRIVDALRLAGYDIEYRVYNAADYGVAQTRKRLMLRASRVGRVPSLPQTHREGGESGGLFGDEHALKPWVGWYAAVEDLVPTLPESRFAPWQIKRLPQWLNASSLVYEQNASREPTVLSSERPAATVGCFSPKHPAPKSFLLSNANTEFSDGIRYADEPALATTQQHGGRLRALLVGGANTSAEQGLPGVGVPDTGEPARCVNASNSLHWRALLVDAGTPNRPEPLTRRDDEPALTVIVADKRGPNRALLVHGGISGCDLPREGREPAFSITASPKTAEPRAWLEMGRVVAMSPRALARFQSVPDTYRLPEKAALACRIVGNGVACLLAQRIGEAWLGGGR